MRIPIKVLVLPLLLFTFFGGVSAQEDSLWEADTPMLGNADAKVTILVFSDFQCPACRVASTVLGSVVEPLKEKVRLFYMHYPLDQAYNRRMTRQLHAEAGRAAVASMCAQVQGDFWGYYKQLFENQNRLDEAVMLELAEGFGWDVSEFKSCMASDRMKQRIRADIIRGQRLEVNQTPTVFVNDERVTMWHSEALLKMFIERKIRESEES